jgi:uncharacterized membrane protein YidH (DUF202 family)
MLLTMKKLLTISPAKIFTLCALGLLITLGGFWHHQLNQSQMDKINVLNQGISTCFNRISQTFTALMIKDINSSYLNRGFMGISDECLNETIKGIKPFGQQLGNGLETLNKLITDTHWFHEAVSRAHSPMVAGKELNPSLAPISTKYSQMETLKLNLSDNLELGRSQLRRIQSHDEILMGSGLLIFTLGLIALAFIEFKRREQQLELEDYALNLLKAGQASIGAMVDQLIQRSLTAMNLPVCAQVFRDYHGEMLEQSAGKQTYNEKKSPLPIMAQVEEEKIHTDESSYSGPRTSLKEILVSIQNINSKDVISASDVRDVQLAVNAEDFEQLFNAAVNKLMSRRVDNKKIMISNQVHSDRCVINFFLAGNTFNAGELDFAQNDSSVSVDGIDTNMILLREMALETQTNWHVENKTDRNGAITGMAIRFTVKRSPKEMRTKNLVSVVRGKKKDLALELMN